MAKVKQSLGVIVVLFLLIGLPLVSYYYLEKGFAYRKAAIETQSDFGKMPDLGAFTSVRGEHPTTYRGAMTVVSWLDPRKPVTIKQYGMMLDSLYTQFEDSPNLYFTNFVKGENAAATAAQFADQYNLPDTDMINFLATDDAAFAQSARDFKLPLTGGNMPGEAPIVALVDSSLTIVKHYDLSSRNETIGLVQLISVIIPLPVRRDLILDRSKEL
ncbi:hypothetical protein FUA23_14985 [Neolewinella aurantiaca]|uniref:Uncharacterized protein n=1 Tax=Neolewinella aurantiaca TaxID=2602767 RepID=A0A5C7FSQ0_9BACT|nr:hypothetical protein [Neolewinella aurantiaca]TXF88438.1 hypothetical protein FUA23_14985 [Neolewinella aurantiaca]